MRHDLCMLVEADGAAGMTRRILRVITPDSTQMIEKIIQTETADKAIASI
jgi:hypothetical protein